MKNTVCRKMFRVSLCLGMNCNWLHSSADLARPVDARECMEEQEHFTVVRGQRIRYGRIKRDDTEPNEP